MVTYPQSHIQKRREKKRKAKENKLPTKHVPQIQNRI